MHIRAMEHLLNGSLWLCVAYQQHERQGVSYTEGFCQSTVCSHLFCNEISEFRSKKQRATTFFTVTVSHV